MKAYLIGLNHNIQYIYDGRPYAPTCFREYIESAIDQHSISLIAEELSVEAIQREKASGSISHVIAASKGIGHVYADPDFQTRESLGIPSEETIKDELGLGRTLSSEELLRLDQEKVKYHSIREEYWLSQINEHFGNILFLCGDSHVVGFCSLLEKRHVETMTLSTNWNATSNI